MVTFVSLPLNPHDSKCNPSLVFPEISCFSSDKTCLMPLSIKIPNLDLSSQPLSVQTERAKACLRSHTCQSQSPARAQASDSQTGALSLYHVPWRLWKRQFFMWGEFGIKILFFFSISKLTLSETTITFYLFFSFLSVVNGLIPVREWRLVKFLSECHMEQTTSLKEKKSVLEDSPHYPGRKAKLLHLN